MPVPRPSPELRRLFRLFTTRDARDFLRGMPGRALAPLGGAIFFLFAVMGFITDIIDGGRHPPQLLASNAVFGGLFGVGYAYTSLRSVPPRIAVFAAHATYVAVVNRITGRAAAGALDLDRLRLDGVAIVVCITVSYTFFLRFIGTTGLQYLTARAEIRLASEIHAVLVPVIDRRIGEYEFYGVSYASGEVGGDLVDVVVTGSDGWIGYVADVSGHGVSSGVLMGMTKSAAHMRLRNDASLPELLTSLNDVLYTLKRPSMFVTFVGVRALGAHRFEFSVAGHLPLLRITQAGAVEELTTPQIPVGMFEDYAFVAGELACAPGEMLALVTDGLTEVFDRADDEYGFERVKRHLAGHAGQPLRAVADTLVQDVARHGAQLDDQTLLLIRRSASRTHNAHDELQTSKVLEFEG